MANSVNPDETALYEPSHLDLHCLHILISCFLKIVVSLKIIYTKQKKKSDICLQGKKARFVKIVTELDDLHKTCILMQI